MEPSRSTAPGAVNPFQQTAFMITVSDARDLPRTTEPEVAFVGRSNTGKSSAINALTNQTRLAFVSKTPGRTQHINFFRVGTKGYFVDLPGYGFAAAPGAIKDRWQALVSDYLMTRQPLSGLVLIMDARHPLKPLDRQMLDWFAPTGKPVHALLTKCDKLSRAGRVETLRRVRADLGLMPGILSAQLFSSLTREGLDEAIDAVSKLLENKPQPNDGAGTEIKTPGKGDKPGVETP
jgi:GTP-binding protein